MAEVSIIVPVYQVEKYISFCIDSILSQTFTDFELILIDDGSKDNSGLICDEYAKKDKRVKVIHQKNSGVSVARNKGIECAKGDYICFVDSDDKIDNTMIEDCVSCIKKEGADVLRHGHITKLWKDGKCVNEEKAVAPCFAFSLTHSQIAEKMEQFWQNCSNYVWNYFFKREALENVKFPDIKISEDHVFVLRVLQKCEKICFLSKEPYHYCMRMGSSANRWQETGIECQLYMINACYHFMDSFGIETERKTKILSNMVLNAYSYVIYLLCFPQCNKSFKEKSDKIDFVRKELQIDMYTSYADLKGLSFGDKIKLKLICMHFEKLLLLIGPIFMKVIRKAD
ncbi:MAG: glycosyltransferase family 2 protein [Clostridia bacterium]